MDKPSQKPPSGSRGYTATEAAHLRRSVTLQNWDDGGEVSRFAYLHISEIFPTAVIHRGGPVSPLEEVREPAIGAYIVNRENGLKMTLDEYISEGHSFDGFILLHHGRIVYEKYPRMRREDKHLFMSVTKAFIGTAVGILEDRGQIDIRRPVGDYIAALKGTAWEIISVRDILEMASGMEGDQSHETYSDPATKHYQYEASLGWLPKTPELPDSVREEDTYRFLASLKQIRKPGETWTYTSVNTAILGWLLEEVTGKSIAEVLSDEIWIPMEAESDALICVNRVGIAVAHAGMTATLRDLARFGLLFTPSWNKTTRTRVISENFLRRIVEGGRRGLVKDWIDGPRPNWLDHVAYQWDAVSNKGAFMKGGFGGQFLFVAPHQDVVIAYFGTNENLSPLPLDFIPNTMLEDLFGSSDKK